MTGISLLSLDDVPLDLADECYDGAGLYCPDDPLDSLGNYVDDELLEAIGCSPLSFCPFAGAGDGAEDMEVVDVPRFSRTVRGGGSETCGALAGRHLHVVPPWPAETEAVACSMPLPSSEVPPPPSSPFESSTVTRRERRGPATVRGHAWSGHALSGPLPSSFRKSGSKVSRGGGKRRPEVGRGGGRRRSAGPRQRNRRADRKCAHCAVEETPQWRAGPGGAGTLCNACGIRYSLGKDKLVPEYRPSTSPSFRSDEHSNRDRNVGIIRLKKTRRLKVDRDDRTGDGYGDDRTDDGDGDDHTGDGDGGGEFLSERTYRITDSCH